MSTTTPPKGIPGVPRYRAYRTPETGASTDDWRHQAACRRFDPELWFSDDLEICDQAVAVCAGCPVRPECLDHALATRQPSGVWGGQVFHGGVGLTVETLRLRRRR